MTTPDTARQWLADNGEPSPYYIVAGPARLEHLRHCALSHDESGPVVLRPDGYNVFATALLTCTCGNTRNLPVRRRVEFVAELATALFPDTVAEIQSTDTPNSDGPFGWACWLADGSLMGLYCDADAWATEEHMWAEIERDDPGTRARGAELEALDQDRYDFLSVLMDEDDSAGVRQRAVVLPYALQKQLRPRTAPVGYCPECGTRQLMRSDNTLTSHKVGRRGCGGAYRLTLGLMHTP